MSQLPIIKIRGKDYFMDERLGEVRAVDNPHEVLDEHEAMALIIEQTLNHTLEHEKKN